MKKVMLLLTVLLVSLLVACTSKEQKAYEDALQQAKEKITAEEFDDAHELLMQAVSTDYEVRLEAENLLKQLEHYQSLENLLSEAKFDDVYITTGIITQIEHGSTVISEKAKEFKEKTEQQHQQYSTLQEKVNESLKLVEDKKYDQANEQLKTLDLTNYQESYYDSIKTTITETIVSNDEQIAVIQAEEQRIAEEKKKEEARQKAEAERKAKEEAARKNNMLHWTDDQIIRYIADYLNRNVNHLIIDIYDRTNLGYSIEVRQDNEAMGVGDPGVAPAMGFFEVRADGKLYKMDIASGDYVQVN